MAKRRAWSAGFALATVAAGLLVRFGPLGLPRFAVKYGGSMLWALAIYWVVSALLPGRGALSVAFLAGALAASVEPFKLFRSPWLDAFRLTFAGGLLLGRVFSVRDIAAYWLAAAIGAVLDRWLRRRGGCDSEVGLRTASSGMADGKGREVW